MIHNDYIFKVPNELLWDNVEIDRCPYVWEKLYIPYYLNDEFWKTSIYGNAVKKGDFFFGNCKISGETVFNFGIGKKGNVNQKFEYFYRVLVDSYCGNECTYYLNKLIECSYNNYSLNNFALMPCTAGMNNFKGTSKYMSEVNNQKLDRFDKFIFWLNDFLNSPKRSVDHIIFSCAYGKTSKDRTAEENTRVLKKALFNFLTNFSNIGEYCKYMYLIEDSDYIDKLIENGQTPIVSGEDVVRYMELAEEYWKIKGERIK